MARVMALSAALAVACAGAPDLALAQQGAAPTQAAPAVDRAAWGLLADLPGTEWRGGVARQRFIWVEPDRVLAWQTKPLLAGDWFDIGVFSRVPGGVQGSLQNGRSGALVVGGDMTELRAPGAAAAALTIRKTGESFRIEQSGLIGSAFTLEPRGESAVSLDAAAKARFIARQQTNPIMGLAGGVPTATGGQAALAALSAAPAQPGSQPTAPSGQPRAPAAPIILSQGSGSAPQPGSAQRGQGAAAGRPTAPQGASAPAAAAGPIVIASAPPPPAAIRQGAPTPRAQATPPATASTREAQMQAQVQARRQQAAREAEAERQRQAAAAEAARQAEAQRRAEAEANAAGWREGFAFVGSILGGAIVGSAGGGSMEAVSAGMAIGANLVGGDTEVAQATNQVFAQEHQKAEEQRQFEREVIAAMNDPNNPLTQQARREEAERNERNAREKAEMEQRHKEAEAREAADREALMNQRVQERQADQTAETERRAEEQRQEQQRRQAEAQRQREREAERVRAEEEARRQEAERQRQAQQEAQRREQEERRQAEERRRAERDRMMRTGNASGGISLTSGLPQVNPSSRGPGSGTVTVPMDHIGACRATGATVRYSLGGALGDAIVGGGLAWSGEEGCSVPASTNAWIKVQWNGTYGWVSLGASAGSANGGPGYNSPGSPPWSQLLCAFEGARRTHCMDADSARKLWTNGTVTEVRIGW